MSFHPLSHRGAAAAWLYRLASAPLVVCAVTAGTPGGVRAQAPAEASAASVPPAAGLVFGPQDPGFLIRLPRLDADVATDLPRREVLIRWPQAVPPFDAARLLTQAAGWLEGVHVGYDTVLLRLGDGVAVQVVLNDAELTLRLARAAVDPVPAGTPQAQRGGSLRLDLLRARLLLRDQQLAQARERFTALRAALPDSAEPVLGLAQVAQQTGHWRRSLELYRDAQQLAGADQAIQAATEALARDHAGALRLESEYRRSQGGDLSAPVTLERIGATAARRLAPAWQLSVSAESAAIDTDALQRPDGRVEPFSGREQRASLSLQHDGVEGPMQAVSLFAASGGGGLGWQRSQGDDHGSTRYVIEARRPDWDYVEGIAGQARRDRLAVARTQRLGAGLAGRLELGLNRHGLPGDSQTAQTTSLAGELRLDSVAGVAGLSATYALEAQYVRRGYLKQTPDGETFSPLPLEDREVHMATVGYTRTLGEDPATAGSWRFDGQAGAGIDRYGRGGPIFGAALTWARGRLLAQVRAHHTRNVGRSSGSSHAVGVFISFSF